MTEDKKVALTEDEIENVFKDTTSEEKLGNQWLQENLQALKEEPTSLQEAVNGMCIQIHNQANKFFYENFRNKCCCLVWHRH